jgi:predicted 3-demethylubiquinone-9 3-methyltransferase (glyoxalase superfamily)
MPEQKITTFLMFNDQTDAAVNKYISIFKNSRIIDATRYGPDGPGAEGTMMGATFELDGQRFMAFNGGPHFSFAEGMSLMVNCNSQAEVDELWEKLTADGGEESMCGWLKDPFGVSWQIIPKRLMEMLSDPDPEKAQRATQAMLQMRKIDIAALERAYAGE